MRESLSAGIMTCAPPALGSIGATGCPVSSAGEIRKTSAIESMNTVLVNRRLPFSTMLR